MTPRPCQPVVVHMLFVAAIGLLAMILFVLVSGGDPAGSLRSLAALPGQLADGRTRRYVMCLAIPLIALPAAVALWCAPDARAGRLRLASVVGRALVCGLAATALFWLAVRLALSTAPTRPGLIAHHTLRAAWMFVLLWSVVHAAIACLAHGATIRLLHGQRGDTAR